MRDSGLLHALLALEDRAALERHPKCGPDLDEIRGGASASILSELKRLLSISDLELVAIVGIPRQTMLRRLKQGRLNRHESDRVARPTSVYNGALEFFDWSRESAVRWLKHPILRCVGKRPWSIRTRRWGVGGAGGFPSPRPRHPLERPVRVWRLARTQLAAVRHLHDPHR